MASYKHITRRLPDTVNTKDVLFSVMALAVVVAAGGVPWWEVAGEGPTLADRVTTTVDERVGEQRRLVVVVVEAAVLFRQSPTSAKKHSHLKGHKVRSNRQRPAAVASYAVSHKMRTNTDPSTRPYSAANAAAVVVTARREFGRLVAAGVSWEDRLPEDGSETADIEGTRRDPHR